MTNPLSATILDLYDAITKTEGYIDSGQLKEAVFMISTLKEKMAGFVEAIVEMDGEVLK